MNFQNFELEYFQSQFERTVQYNLADSSVKCASVSDLLQGEDPRQVTELALYYPEVNGSALLRERIAELYRGRSREQCPRNRGRGAGELDHLRITAATGR